MSYFLRDGLSFCDVAGRYIFLDITSDRYFLLGSKENAALASILRQQTGAALPSDLGSIFSLIGDRRSGTPLAPTHIPKPSCSAIEMAAAPSRFEYPTILLAFARARRDVRSKPLAQLLKPGRYPSLLQYKDDEKLIRLAHGFERVASWFGREKNCLPRSIALWRFLHRRGHCAQIVFGVKDFPFAAHCWVQSGSLLLNDRLETIRPFTPVLVR